MKQDLSATHESSLHVVHGQPSWRLASTDVEAFITQRGGHLGPVSFDLNGRHISPFNLAPWAEEATDPSTPPVLKVLRGDFFCMPFGDNTDPVSGEQHPPHGETANELWQFEGIEECSGERRIHLSMETQVRKGRVDKHIGLSDGHRALYIQHAVAGMSGPMNPGHHAMLKFPDDPGCGAISTSPFLYGQVLPHPFEQPEDKGYSFLKPGAEFTSLSQVPTITGELTDLSIYPARRGYDDLVMMVSDSNLPFAWTAVAFPKYGYVWFALKDPKVLHETILWISNGGRHYAPWNGRHVNVMGLEEVTADFNPGLADSMGPNAVAQKGYPTCLEFSPEQPTVFNYVMAVAAIPPDFDRVESIKAGPEGVTLISRNGVRVTSPVDSTFLESAAFGSVK